MGLFIQAVNLSLKLYSNMYVSNMYISNICFKYCSGAVSPLPFIKEKLDGQADYVEASLKLLRCGTCGKVALKSKGLAPCSGCLKVFYCSRWCQKIGWTTCRHRKVCSRQFIWFKKRLQQAKKSPFA